MTKHSPEDDTGQAPDAKSQEDPAKAFLRFIISWSFIGSFAVVLGGAVWTIVGDSVFGRVLLALGFCCLCFLVCHRLWQKWSLRYALPAVLSVVIIVFTAVILAIHNRTGGKFVWLPPELPVDCKNVQLIFGGTKTEVALSEISTSHYLVLGKFEPIKWRIDANRFYVDVDIPLDGKTVKLRGGQFSSEMPPMWEMNFNSNALEIVTGNGNPVYQVYYRRPDEVVVNGIFAQGNFLVGSTTNGFEWWTGRSNVISTLAEFYRGAKATGIRPIFKYPYFKHAGEYADN